MKIFLERMKELQGERTQREFAKELEIPLNSYTNWFLYGRSPSIDTLSSICTKLGASADWLLGFSDERSPVRGSVANKPTDQNPNDLIAENAALRGEVKGLRYALDMAIKGAKSVQCSASRGLTA